MSKLTVSFKEGVRLIKFNNQRKKNAIDPSMYIELTQILNADAQDDNVIVTILTGTGEFYSSGTDLTLSEADANIPPKERIQIVKRFVRAFLDYPKILIAVVNGPAIGIAATSTALCDITYASDRATFQTPFVRLGLCAEGGSSLLFPRILGKSKASEMLLLGHKLSAREALEFGLVAQVIPHDELDAFVAKLHRFGVELPVNSVKITKRLMKVAGDSERVIDECLERECKQLEECMESDDFANVIMSFMLKEKGRSKL